MTSNLDHALELAGRGIAVFPCHPNKTPATPRGFKDASCNLALIESWFSEKSYLIGVPTGSDNNLFVVDIDPEGKEWAAENAERLMCERFHKTARGVHMIYAWPKDLPTTGTTASFLSPGVDTRGIGGYIIWWPALNHRAIGDLELLTPPPSWLLEQLAKLKSEHSGQSDDSELSLKEGARNSGLTSMAGRLRRAGLNETQLGALLLKLNENACRPPLPAREVHSIARSVATYPAEDNLAKQKKPSANSSLEWLKQFEMTEEEVAAINDPAWAIPGLIAEGHVVAIAGEPGSGKTTICFDLCKRLASSYEVVYVHADTNPSDAKDYFLQARSADIRYLTPDMKVGLSMADVVVHLKKLAASDAELSGHFWIFDTLKKMADMIQKKDLKDVLQLMRKLSNRGMTVVLLCHTNKNKDAKGQSIFEGTGDLKSDVDELIYFDPLKNSDGTLLVTTRPDKVRADIRPMTFEIHQNRSVSHKEEAVNVAALVANAERKAKDEPVIEQITAAIKSRETKQADIISYCNAKAGLGEHRVRSTLKRYSEPGPMQLWKVTKLLTNNTHVYSLHSEHAPG